MSTNQIMDWIAARFGMKNRDDYYDIGRKTVHIVKYENGDEYEHIEIYHCEGNYIDNSRKQIITKLNGEIVRDENLVYYNFRWNAA